MKLGKVMIFGDSYSTYEGYIPKGYLDYYTGHGDPPDVFDVKHTWWRRVLDTTDSELVQNNSWSGSTIGYTGYNNSDCSHSSSFIYRFEKLLEEGFFEENKIDTLFVFGGTNDSWAEAPLGELKYEITEEKELFCILPAIAHFAKRLKECLSNVKVVFIANCNIKIQIIDTMKEVSEHYGFEFIKLSDIDKVNGHPTELGMEQISKQVLEGMK